MPKGGLKPPPSYLSLHHQGPLLPHFFDEGIDLQCGFHLHPLQHAIQDYERPRPPDTSAAVHHQWGALIVRIVLPDTLDKLDEAGLVCRHAMVRPRREVKVCNMQWLRVLFRRLKSYQQFYSDKFSQ